MCREAAGSEPDAGVTGIAHHSKSGVQSCQGSLNYLEVKGRVSGFIPEMEAQDF